MAGIVLWAALYSQTASVAHWLTYDLVGTNGAVLPAAMAEFAPWRVRCTVLSVGYNVALALLGGTTPIVAAWLVSRTGVTSRPGSTSPLPAPSPS